MAGYARVYIVVIRADTDSKQEREKNLRCQSDLYEISSDENKLGDVKGEIHSRLQGAERRAVLVSRG